MQSRFQAQGQAKRPSSDPDRTLDGCEMPATPAKTPVLILGSYITALGTMRSLAAAGVEARCITTQHNFVRCSRWYRRPPAKTDFVTAIDDLPDYLHQLPAEKAVLMPCSDEWVSVVANLGPEFDSRYPRSQPSKESLEFFLDKGKLEHKLEALGVPRPCTILLESENQLEAVGKDEFITLFLKPRCSREFFLSFGVKAFQLRSAKEAAVLFARCQKCGFKVMLQEYIPGPASRHIFVDGFVDRHGEFKAVFARQRMRMYPLDFGDSSYMTTIPVEQASQAVDSLKKLLPAVNYRGIFSAEFKMDGRDDTYKLIEVNTRPWTYINFDSTHGMNMAEMSYRDALGFDLPTVTEYDIGASMVYMPNDVGACWGLFRRDELSLVDWFTSWFRAGSAVFVWSDPLPIIVWWWNVLVGRFERMFSRRKVER